MRLIQKDILATLLLVLLFAVIVASVKISMTPFVRIGMQAEKVLKGHETAFDSEYPPLASALFTVLQSNPLTSFNAGWKAILIIVLALSTLYAFKVSDRRDALFLPLAVLLTIPLLGTEVTLARYDLLVTFLLFVAWQGTKHCHDTAAGIALGLAASLKIVPMLLLPFLWLRAERQGKLLLGTIVGIGVGLLIPLLVLGPHLTLQNIAYVRSFHGARGIQLESTWAGLLLLFSALTGSTVTIDNLHSAFEVMGPAFIPPLATILTLAGLGLLWRKGYRSKRNPSDASLPLLALLWALLMTPVLSPQYFVWIVPLLLIESFDRLRDDTRSGIVLLTLTALTGLLTHWIFPILYDQLVHLALWPVLILNARNLCVVGLIMVLWRASKSKMQALHNGPHPGTGCS